MNNFECGGFYLMSYIHPARTLFYKPCLFFLVLRRTEYRGYQKQGENNEDESEQSRSYAKVCYYDNYQDFQPCRQFLEFFYEPRFLFFIVLFHFVYKSSPLAWLFMLS